MLWKRHQPQFIALRILSGKGEVQIMPFRKLSRKCHFLLRFCMCNWSETYIYTIYWCTHNKYLGMVCYFVGGNRPGLLRTLGFPVGSRGRANPRGVETICTDGGGASLAPPWIRHCWPQIGSTVPWMSVHVHCYFIYFFVYISIM